MVKVYFETRSYAEIVAVFPDSESYGLLFDRLEQLAKQDRYFITESVIEEDTDEDTEEFRKQIEDRGLTPSSLAMAIYPLVTEILNENTIVVDVESARSLFYYLEKYGKGINLNFCIDTETSGDGSIVFDKSDVSFLDPKLLIPKDHDPKAQESLKNLLPDGNQKRELQILLVGGAGFAQIQAFESELKKKFLESTGLPPEKFTFEVRGAKSIPELNVKKILPHIDPQPSVIVNEMRPTTPKEFGMKRNKGNFKNKKK